MSKTMYGATDVTVAARDADGYVLFLQTGTNQWVVAGPAAWRVWQALERGLNVQDAVVAAAGSTDTAGVSAHLEPALPELARAGILTGRRPAPPAERLRSILAGGAPAPRRESVDSLDRRDGESARVTLAAAAGFALALVLRLLPFRLRLEVLISVRRCRPRRPGLAETRRLAAAVKRIASRWPGSADCLEQSMASFLAGALRRAAPEWCLGGSIEGASYHAWVQAGDVAVDHAPQDGAEFMTMLRV
jgi:hypothetical protein